MFVDECVIKVQAGDGGRGCIAFRREKYEPWGGPNGGDGGNGGDVVLVGDHDTNNLVDFKYKPHWKGERGEHGQGKDCHGREGRPAVLRMPLGTVVTDEATGQVVAEMVEDGQRDRPLQRRQRRLGQHPFQDLDQPGPAARQPGPAGRARRLPLVLKSIADVGLVGFPNAGKSSLTNPITQRPPEDGGLSLHDAPPADRRDRRPRRAAGAGGCLLADIPGLIEGASENRGLGHRFLRHIERCALLVLLVDMAGVDGRDPRDDYKHLLRELELYDPALLRKPRLVAANKMDLPEAARPPGEVQAPPQGRRPRDLLPDGSRARAA